MGCANHWVCGLLLEETPAKGGQSHNTRAFDEPHARYALRACLHWSKQWVHLRHIVKP
jgi:hypothetical protein